MEVKTTLVLDKHDLINAVRNFVGNHGFQAQLVKFTTGEQTTDGLGVTGCEVEVIKNNDE